MASALGRTCSTIAFRFNDLARSRIAMASACCLATGKLLRLGQSILATVDTQAARNSRGAGGGTSPVMCSTGGKPGKAVMPGVVSAVILVLLQLLSKPATASAAIALAAAPSRFFNVESKTIPCRNMVRSMITQLSTQLSGAFYCAPAFSEATHSHQSQAAAFLPNSGSILTSAAMMKAGTVAIQTQMKKC